MQNQGSGKIAKGTDLITMMRHDLQGKRYTTTNDVQVHITT
jgi:hypothetical protein